MTSDRPTGVTILAILNVLGGLLSIFGGLIATVFGGIGGIGAAVTQADPRATGAVTAIFVFGVVGVITGILALVVGYGLFTLKGWAWLLAIAIQSIGIVNNLLALFSGKVNAIGILASITISVAILYYLNTISVKAAFGRAQDTV